jgi:hypothetical protein
VLVQLLLAVARHGHWLLASEAFKSLHMRFRQLICTTIGLKRSTRKHVCSVSQECSTEFLANRAMDCSYKMKRTLRRAITLEL